MSHKPTVLFVCVHNAGRSQMAAGWLQHLAGDQVEIRSAGSEPADQINPLAVEAMREVCVDISGWELCRSTESTNVETRTDGGPPAQSRPAAGSASTSRQE